MPSLLDLLDKETKSAIIEPKAASTGAATPAGTANQKKSLLDLLPPEVVSSVSGLSRQPVVGAQATSATGDPISQPRRNFLRSPEIEKIIEKYDPEFAKQRAILHDPTRQRSRLEHTAETLLSGALPGYEVQGPKDQYTGIANEIVDSVTHLVGMGMTLRGIQSAATKLGKGLGPLSSFTESPTGQKALATLGKYAKAIPEIIREMETFGLYRSLAPTEGKTIAEKAVGRAKAYGVGNLEGAFFALLGKGTKSGTEAILPSLKPGIKQAAATSAAFGGLKAIEPTPTKFSDDPVQATVERFKNIGVGILTGSLLTAINLAPTAFKPATDKLGKSTPGSQEEILAMSEIVKLADSKLKESGYEYTTADILSGRVPKNVEIKPESALPEGSQVKAPGLKDTVRTGASPRYIGTGGENAPLIKQESELLTKRISRQQIKKIKVTESELKAGQETYDNLIKTITDSQATSIKNMTRVEASKYINALENLKSKGTVGQSPPPEDLISKMKGKVAPPEKTPLEKLPEKPVTEIPPQNIPQNIPAKKNLAPNETIATGPDGTKHLLKYKVVDLGDIIENKNFQPRDRSRVASKAQIQQIVSKFDPELALDKTISLDRGTEIVTPDNEILAGFGRIAAKKEIARLSPEKKSMYLKELENQLSNFGLTQKDLANKKFPVLVREAQAPELFQNIAEQSNVKVTAGHGAPEDINFYTPKVKNEWLQEIKGVGKSVEDVVTSPSNKEVFGKIRNLIPVTEQNKMLDAEGNFSKSFVEFAKGVLFSKAYSNDQYLLGQLTDETESNIKNILNAMKDASPTAAAVNSLPVKKSLKIDEDLVTVAKKMIAIRESGISVDEAVTQRGFEFGTNLTPDQVKLIKFIDANKGSKPKIQAFIERYHELLRQAPLEGQGALFEGEQTTKSELMDFALEIPQKGLFETTPDGTEELSFLGAAKVAGAGKRAMAFFRDITHPLRQITPEETSIIPVSEVTKLTPEKITAISYSATGEKSLSPREAMALKPENFKSLQDIEKEKPLGRRSIKSGDYVTVYRADPDPHAIALPGAEVFLSEKEALAAGQGKLRKMSIPANEILRRNEAFIYRPATNQRAYERLVQHTIAPKLGAETLLSKAQSLRVASQKHGFNILTEELRDKYDVFGFQTSINKEVMNKSREVFLSENKTTALTATAKFLKNKPLPALEGLTADLENIGQYNSLDAWSDAMNKKYTGKPNSRAIVTWYQKLMDATLELENASRAKLGQAPIPRRKFYVEWVKSETKMAELQKEADKRYKLSPTLPEDPSAKERTSEGLDRRLDPFELAERRLNLAQRSILFSEEAARFTHLFSALKPTLDKPERQMLEEFFRTVTSSDIPNADKISNATLEKAKITQTVNAILKPVGRSLGNNPSAKISGVIGNLEVNSVLAYRPKPALRNFFQRVQGWTFGSPEAVLKAVTLNDPPELKELMKNSPALNKLRLDMGASVEEFTGKAGGMKWFSERHIGNVENNFRMAYWQGKQMERLGLWNSEDTIKNMEIIPNAAQYVYDSLGRPRIFNSAAGRTALRFNSWWINKTVHYLPEHMERVFHGQTSWGAPVTRRMRAQSAAALLLESGWYPGKQLLKGYTTYKVISHTLGQMGMRQILPSKLNDLGGIEAQAAQNLYNAVQSKDEKESNYYYEKAYSQFLKTKIPLAGLVNDLERTRSRGLSNIILYPTEEQLKAEKELWIRRRRFETSRKRRAKKLLFAQ